MGDLYITDFENKRLLGKNQINPAYLFEYKKVLSNTKDRFSLNMTSYPPGSIFENPKLLANERTIRAVGLLNSWIEENLTSYASYSKIKEHIGISGNYLQIGDTRWDLESISYKSLYSVKKDFDEKGLRVPTFKDIMKCAEFMPGISDTQKLSNLFKILGINELLELCVYNEDLNFSLASSKFYKKFRSLLFGNDTPYNKLDISNNKIDLKTFGQKDDLGLFVGIVKPNYFL